MRQPNITHRGFRTNPYDIDNGITSQFGAWNLPELVAVEELENSIEFTYIEHSNITYTAMIPLPESRRVFKIVFYCHEGEWKKSGRIYGIIQPSSDETYRF
jgi:hypothetical protein